MKTLMIKKNDISPISYFKRIISPSEDELNKHKEYLKNNLKKNFF